MIKYLARFKQGDSPISTNCIDYYKEEGKIIKHEWGMGGEDKEEVKEVPKIIKNYKKVL